MASKRSKHELPPSPSPSSHEDDGDSSDSESESESDAGETVVVKPQPVSKKSSSSKPKRALETELFPKEKETKKAKLSREEEEIAFLKAMIDYEEKIGQSPSLDLEAFHAFVKKSLSTDASRTQVYDKLRRLKKKYLENVDKLNKEGASSSSLKPHPKRVFDLSKKIWRSSEANGGLQSPCKSASKPESPKPPTPAVEPEKVTSLAPFVSLAVSKSCEDMQSCVIEQGLKSLTGAQRAEFAERYAKLQTELLEHLVVRNELVHQNSKMVLEARK